MSYSEEQLYKDGDTLYLGKPASELGELFRGWTQETPLTCLSTQRVNGHDCINVQGPDGRSAIGAIEIFVPINP